MRADDWRTTCAVTATIAETLKTWYRYNSTKIRSIMRKEKRRTLAKDFYENVKKSPKMSLFPKLRYNTPPPIDTQTIFFSTWIFHQPSACHRQKTVEIFMLNFFFALTSILKFLARPTHLFISSFVSVHHSSRLHLNTSNLLTDTNSLNYFFYHELFYR